MTVLPNAFTDIHFPWLRLSLLFLCVDSVLLGRRRRVYMLPQESLPGRVDALYSNIKFIQRISFERQKVPEDSKYFQTRFSYFSFRIEGYEHVG